MSEQLPFDGNGGAGYTTPYLYIFAQTEVTLMEIPADVTRTVVAQYEALRRMGNVNMFHYARIQREAIDLHLKALIGLDKSTYYFILQHDSQLVTHFGLDDITDPATLAAIRESS